MSRSSLVAFAAVLIGLGAGWMLHSARPARIDDFAQKRAALLQSENERLRAQITAHQAALRSPAELATRQEIERQTAITRELSFKHPVTYDIVTRAGIRTMLTEKLGSAYKDDDFTRWGLGLSAFGLIPPGYDLKQKFIALLSEQVAAFYDQHARKLYMFEDASLASAQNRMILSHELTHALQDQNFDLRKLPLETKTNDDLAFATSALIEGDATVEMTQFMAGQVNLKTMFETIGGAFTQNMTEIQTAPRYLREMLLAPYLRGQLFVTALMQQGGWDAVSAALRDPPQSSTEILHPEKYLATPRWRPTRIEWRDTTFQGQKPVADNVLGELGIRLLLTAENDPRGAEAAAGWQGDRYLVFDQGHTLIWITEWETPAQAQRFLASLQKAWQERFSDRHFALRANGTRIVFTQAKDDATVAVLHQKFAR